MVGRDRHGRPVTVHLTGPEPTRAVLAGGVRATALVAVRALALGTHVVVQTTRPGTWEVYLRAVSAPGDAVPLVPPERPVVAPPATSLAPQLVIVDGEGVPVAPAPWRTTLVVRDGLRATDVDTLARADLVILQPLPPDEAALAGAALGLGKDGEWLTMIRADMVAVVSRRRVRWAQLSATPIELRVIGPPERPARVSPVPG
jgi:hypothetical protein